MIITRTPFRVSFCGGGSDLQSFYQDQEGCVVSTTIDKYMYISLHPYFEPDQISLKYSKTELVDDVRKIEHRIFREALKQFGITGLEITSTADIPAGAGLGSSSAFTVGLLHALSVYTGKPVTRYGLAENACDIEIKRLGSPVGKQDQYAAAFGGLNFIRFLPSGETIVEPLRIDQEKLQKLEKRLIMCYTGKLHNANSILLEQKANMSQIDKTESIRQMCVLAKQLKEALEHGQIEAVGELLHENWLLKKTLASSISDLSLNEIYDTALRYGAKGGKLLGAGGGGFFLFYCEEERQEELRNALSLRQIPFHLENGGSSVIHLDK